MTGARYLVGDVFDVLATLEDGSVDLILTSPPFLALRSYLPADHPDKGKEIGSEATPAAFIDTLLDLTEEWARVLAPHGSLCVELGDTYSGSGGAGGDYNADGMRDGQEKFDGSARRGRTRTDGGRYMDGYSGGSTGHNVDLSNGGFSERPANGGNGWPLAKSLCLIPELYRISLVYGFNPLTGRTTPQWRARNVVRWCRPNPPVGALGDKFRPATSEMVVACKSTKRWFDLDAVRHQNDRNDETGGGQKREMARVKVGLSSGTNLGGSIVQNPAGAPPLDYWVIPTHGFKGSHYATFPPALCVTPIESMCPRRVCRTCGKASERITEVEGLHGQDILSIGTDNDRGTGLQGKRPPMPDITRTTLGWSDCGCDDWRPGLVLDPFAGSGTTLAVATGHGRDAIGIDLDARNADLARERCGMFLTIHETPTIVDTPTGDHL